MSVLFALGSNGSGQLGIGHKEDVSVPKQVLFHPEPPSSPIVKVAAGGNHTLLLTEDGQLYCSGNRDAGACGLAPAAPVTEHEFQRILLSRDGSVSGPTVLVAAAWEASLVVQKDDRGKATRLYSLGAGEKGELGQGQMLFRTPSATQFKDFPPPDTEIVDMAASMGHIIAVLSNGDAYGWGNGRKGQLGAPEEVIYTPRKIDGISFKVVRAVCGREFTCLLGERSTGELLVIGSEKWNVRSGAPESVPGWDDIGAGWGSICILKDGMLQSWGRNDHGQLPSPNLPPLTKIAVGSEHVVALSTEGDVLSWGWGEHGNCGPQPGNGDVKDRWSVIASAKFIPPDAKITGIGAGCATSWINIKM